MTGAVRSAPRAWRVLRWLPILLAPAAASAVNPATPLQDLHRSTWTTQDGAPVNIVHMAQTTDGWLWLIAKAGLFRFDGVRFEHYLLPGGDQPQRRLPATIRALADGGLLLTYYPGGGVSVLRPDGTLYDLAEPGKDIAPFVAFTPGAAGDIWLAARSGLHHLHDGRWRTLGPAQGLPDGQIEDVKLDRYGRLWATSIQALFLYHADSKTFSKIRDLPAPASLLSSPDGRMWLSSPLGQQALPAPTAGTPLRPRSGVDSFADWTAQFDRDGNLWTINCPVGLCLIANAANQAAGSYTMADATSRLDQPWQLSSLRINTVMEDREGNMWVATKNGLERFRDNRLQPVHLPGNSGVFILNLDSEGKVWAVDQREGVAWQLDHRKAPRAAPGKYYAATIDRSGALLLSSTRDIERHYHGKIEKIPLPAPAGPDGKPSRIEVWGLQDNGKVLWMMSAQTGLMGWTDGRWLPRSAFRQLPPFLLGAAAEAGVSWLAMADGGVVRYSAEQQQRYDGGMIGMATGVFTRGQVLIAGDRGIAVFKEGAFHKLSAAEPEVLQNVSGLAITSNGDRWLNGARGLVHVRKADWLASVAQPALPLRYQLFSVHDGYRGEALLDNRQPSMLADREDRLWLAGTGGIMHFDTRAIYRNTVAPAAVVQAVATLDGKRYSAAPGLRLPAGSHSFNIHYTAPSLRQPEAVRFQYRLDGEDTGWQDAGSRRSALYTGLSPGAYRFQVRAANEDGVWSAQPAVLAVEIPPTIT